MAKREPIAIFWFLMMCLGAGVFLAVGTGMYITGLNAKPTDLTDDGEPLGPFLTSFGLWFVVIGILWIVGTIAMSLWLRTRQRRDEARLAALKSSGVRVDARVIVVESDGYMNFANQLWTNLTLELPPPWQREVSMHVALDNNVLERCRQQHLIAVYIDPRNPNEFMIDGGAT